MTPADLDHLRSWIGREEVAIDQVAPETVRRFHATFDLQGSPPGPGAEAPALIHYCLCPPLAATAMLGPDGHLPTGGFLPPVPLPRRMWAGSTVLFHRSLFVGETVRRTSRVADVTFKQGRSGSLCFVAVAHRWEADGATAIEETQDIVYRDGGSRTAAAAVEKTSRDTLANEAACGPELLFRYSSITFNTHRIHYDQPYAVQVEGYPGLVVHGPLQATLLLHLAIRRRSSVPAEFRFQGRSPLCLPSTIQLHAARDEGDRMRLWTASDIGLVAMTAEARWA